MDGTAESSPPEEPIPDPITLDQRLERLSDVDRKVMDVLTISREMLQSFDKERQISKTKMDDLYKRYSRCMEDIDSTVSDELVYMEYMCVGVEHQGSTFEFQQQAKVTAERLLQLKEGLDKCSSIITRTIDLSGNK